MEVIIGVSNRHIHLKEEHLKILFNEELTIDRKINQPGQYASNFFVTIKTDKNQIEKVRVLGPTRDYSQVEISKTDSYKLGVNPPVCASGDLENASLITIIGPNGQIERNACIIANRHIHVDKDILKEKGLENVREVSLRISGIKRGILENVSLKETEKAYFEVHLDTDDANAFLLKQNDEVEIILTK